MSSQSFGCWWHRPSATLLTCMTGRHLSGGAWQAGAIRMPECCTLTQSRQSSAVTLLERPRQNGVSMHSGHRRHAASKQDIAVEHALAIAIAGVAPLKWALPAGDASHYYRPSSAAKVPNLLLCLQARALSSAEGGPPQSYPLGCWKMWFLSLRTLTKLSR